MNTPENCPRCGSGPYGGTSHYSRFECRTILWDDGTLRLESPQCRINQLTAKLSALESAYAECAEKLYRAEQREHDLKRRLEDALKQRDAFQSVATDPHALWSNWLRGTVQFPAGIGDVRQAEERVRKLEAALCAIRDAMPAINRGGGLFWPMHDGEGNYIGEQNVSEMSVIQNMVTIATDALHTK